MNVDPARPYSVKDEVQAGLPGRDEGRLDAEHFADVFVREYVGAGAGRCDSSVVE